MKGPAYQSNLGGGDARLHAPATRRNRDPILDVLRQVLPKSGTVLELGSGSGEHVIHFAEQLPDLTWLPSDTDPEALASIRAWREDAGLSSILPPAAIDATAVSWDLPDLTGALVAVLAINLIHIAPWETTAGIIQGSARHLAHDGVLILYGPYKRGGRHTAPSNQSFDDMLRRHDPEWGVRDLDAVAELAGHYEFTLDRVVDMPSNNLSVVFRHQAVTQG